TICSGETFNFTPQNGVNGRVPAGTTYTWTRVDNTNISGDSNQSTPQSSISQTLTTTSNLTSIHTVNYTVTPRTGTCPVGPTFQVRVTVNPTPTVNAVSNQTLCEGANTAALTFGGNTIAGKTYT
ncbi:PKD-like domain-containing protein, partial [Campylobacter fetus subsp. venerealis]